MAPRLEVEITGINTGLKKALSESLSELKAFNKQATGINPKGVDNFKSALNAQKSVTSQARAEIAKLNIEIKKNAEAQKAASQPAKRKTEISNSQAEVNAYNNAQRGSILYVSAIKNEFIQRAKLTTQIAAQAAASNNLSLVTNNAANASNQQTQATNKTTLSKKQLAQALAEEKLRQAQSTAELKNNAREMLNAKGSLEQRRAALIRLTKEYDKLSASERATGSGSRLGNIISGLTNQIKGLESATGRSQRNVGNYGNTFSSLQGQLLGAAAGLFTFSAAAAGLNKIVHTNIEISDSLTDVQRTAKLTTNEVDALAKEFKGLDTRTSLAGLLDVGFIGGRLGVAKKDLFGFTKTVDELAVVLKKELPGGAEAVAESLGKIASVYKITQNEGIPLEHALRKIGSAFLDLSHTGPVTVKYMQDFALGVAGSAASAKLSLPVIAAYGAVLSEAGIIASSAAISFTRLVGELSTKRHKYFGIAQLGDSTLTLEKFTHLINTDTKSALDLFFKGLKAGNPTQVEFTERVKSLGFTTGKVTNAIKALAENQDKLREKTKVGSQAYEEATTITHNFELANNNLAASVDKLGNSVSNLTTNPNSSLGKFFKNIVDGANFAVTAISDLSNALSRTQAESDDKLIREKSGKPSFSSFLFGSTQATSKELEEARARRKQRGTAALQDELEGQGSSKADIISAGKSEIQIRSLLTSEIAKQTRAVNKLNYANAFIAAPENKGAAVTKQRDSLNKLKTDLARQNAVVERLKSKLPNLATIIGEGINGDDNQDEVRTIPVIENEIKALIEGNKRLGTQTALFKANVVKLRELKEELRLAKGGKIRNPKGASSINAITPNDILGKSNDRVATSEVEGASKLTEKTKQVYAKYYSDLDKLAKKSGANLKNIDSVRTQIRANEIKELGLIEINEAKRVDSERTRILSEADIKNSENRAKELAEVDKKYSEEIIKANGNELLLSAITEAAQSRRNDIDEKYNQKRIDAEEKIYDKINSITDKGFIANINGSAKAREKLKTQLGDRLKDITKHFDELRKLYATQPEMLLGIAVNEGVAKRGVIAAEAAAQNPDAEKLKEQLKGAVQVFGTDFINTLSKIRDQSGTIFGGIVSNLAETLSSQLNDVFAVSFKETLGKLVTDFKNVSKGALINAGVGLLGAGISGATKKTSGIGQGLGGALTGAAAGAALGPIGAAVGGVLGAVTGIISSSKARKEERELQKRQLAEAEKQTELLRQNALTYTSSIIGRMTDQGILTSVDVGANGTLIATVNGKQIDFVLGRTNNSRG